MIGEIKSAPRRIQTAIKATSPRSDAKVLPDMPLAGHRRKVTGRSQCFRHRDAPIIESPLITGLAAVFGHMPHARLVRIQAGEKRGAGRATTGRIVELSKPQATGSQ